MEALNRLNGCSYGTCMANTITLKFNKKLRNEIIYKTYNLLFKI